ncbi:MAG: SPOR domain-containing protein [Gammaproteobacteria bacterium]|nr:SPOR domain-containing protein [Gammaproteobacteria bacterium]
MGARNDYAKKTTSRGAPRSSSRRGGSSQKAVPGWIWLLAGLSIGLFIAFLVSIADQEIGSKRASSAQKESSKKRSGRADPKKESPAKATRDGVKFDFYHILPEMELVLPADEVEPNTKSAAIATQYIIQVGSFKNAADAESRRAELFLLNFEPSVQTVTIDGKQSWHRVRLGPFIDRRKLDLAQRQLQNSDIDFITLKERR